MEGKCATRYAAPLVMQVRYYKARKLWRGNPSSTGRKACLLQSSACTTGPDLSGACDVVIGGFVQ